MLVGRQRAVGHRLDPHHLRCHAHRAPLQVDVVTSVGGRRRTLPLASARCLHPPPALAPRLRVVGPGRAGASVAGALGEVGWQVLPRWVAATTCRARPATSTCSSWPPPTSAVAATAAAIEPVAGTVVAHLAGSLGLDVLAPHTRRASLHPLVPLPDARTRGGPPAAGGVVRRGRERPAELAVVQQAVDDLGGHGR